MNFSRYMSQRLEEYTTVDGACRRYMQEHGAAMRLWPDAVLEAFAAELARLDPAGMAAVEAMSDAELDALIGRSTMPENGA